MFDSLVQKYRRYKLIKLIEANNYSHMPYLGSYQEREIFDIIDGELVYWNLETLTIHKTDGVYIPAMKHFRMLSRKYDDGCLDRIRKVVHHILDKKYSPQAGVKLFTHAGRDWYVSGLSLMHDDKVVLMAPDRDALFVPAAFFSLLNYGVIKEMHPYILTPVDLCCGGAYSGAKPVIRLVPLAAGAKEGAVTYQQAIKGADGLYDHIACDLIIDVAQLDNSSVPVIDVADFCYIFSNAGLVPSNFQIDVSRIKLLLGMFPQPIEVRRLKDEVGEHRVIFSGDPYSQEANVDYINTDALPTSYP